MKPLSVTRTASPRELLHGGDGNLDGQEIQECFPEKQMEYNKVDTIVLANHGSTIGKPALTIKEQMQKMFLRMFFCQTVAEKLVKDQGIDSPQTLTSLSDEDISAICDLIKRSGSFIDVRMPDRGNSQPCHGHFQDNRRMFQAL